MTHLTAIVGENLYRIRKYFRITQLELGEASGCTAALVSQIERGLVSTRIETLGAIADAFSLNPDIFLRKDGYLEITEGRTLHPVLKATQPKGTP